MKKLLGTIGAVALLAVGAVAAAPEAAAAQCSWGCACVGNACGCNMNGNGGRCDASGSGCVITQCKDAKVFFAPDGSVIHLAIDETEAATRWEWIEDGREVERTCSGLVLARRFDVDEADAIRKQHSTLSL